MTERSLPERLTAVETKLTALAETMDATANDVRAIRDFMLTAKATKAHAGRVLTLTAAVLGGLGTLMGGVAAAAQYFHR